MFRTKLKLAMDKLGINQSQLSALTGIGKSSISQYLSGANEPTVRRKRDMAIAMGLEEDYFEKPLEREIKLAKRPGKVQRISVETAAEIMQMSPSTMRRGLQQGVFGWGYAIRSEPDPETGKVSWSFFINAQRFAEIEGVDIESRNCSTE